jgi:hypothetical protein
VRDPFGRSGSEALQRFTVDAAVINESLRAAADLLGEIPVVIYANGTPVSTIIRRVSEAVRES